MKTDDDLKSPIETKYLSNTYRILSTLQLKITLRYYILKIPLRYQIFLCYDVTNMLKCELFGLCVLVICIGSSDQSIMNGILVCDLPVRMNLLTIKLPYYFYVLQIMLKLMENSCDTPLTLNDNEFNNCIRTFQSVTTLSK